MSESYIRNIPCDMCSSSDGVGVYQREDESYHGTCFVCGEHTNSPFENEEIIEETQEKCMYEMKDSVLSSIPSRGISKEACDKYGVTTITEGGKDVAHFYPNTSNGQEVGAVKRVVEGKKFSFTGDSKNLEFFGQRVCGSNGKMIIVTEGALDCLAVVDMLARSDKRYRTCSVINGASSAVKCFKDNYKWINSFENIFLAFDMDDAGDKAADKVAELFPAGKVKRITMPDKDANDMLLANRHQEFLMAIFNSKGLKETGIVSVDDIFEEAIKPPVPGLSFPWKTLTEATYGFRRGELWGLGSGSGMGKSFCFKELIRHSIFVHNLKVGVIFLEEPASKTLKTLAGLEDGVKYHIPSSKDNPWEVKDLAATITKFKEKVYFFDHFGQKDWDSIKETIRFMVNSLGIKDIYLDHLTALVAQATNEYTEMNRIMEELSSLCEELQCTIFFISHLRKPGGSESHEEGARVKAEQFKGSGSIVFWSHFLIGLERNQQAEDELDRDVTTLRVLKDRNTGNATGLTMQLRYDPKTGRWQEILEEEFDEEEF